MTALLFEINGQPVRAADASWYEYAPCGCCCGVMSAVIGTDVYATEEAVWKHAHPNAEQRRRVQAQGFTHRLGLRSQCVELLSAKCPHTPLYGVEKTPVPEGHEWAREYGYPRSGRRKHIVTSEFRDRVVGETHTALCGAASRQWSGEWYALDGIPECTRCQRAAATASEVSR